MTIEVIQNWLDCAVRIYPEVRFCTMLSFAAARYRVWVCVCDFDASTIRSVISAWLDTYPDDFRTPPLYPALRRLRQFAADQLQDSDLQRRIAERLTALRRQESAQQRRPQSAGAQRQSTSTTQMHSPGFCVFLMLFSDPKSITKTEHYIGSQPGGKSPKLGSGVFDLGNGLFF